MADHIDQNLLDAFFEDAQDVLEQWERHCLKLKPEDDVSAYEPLLRCAHNLKGSAGLTGLNELNAALHRIEDQLIRLRDLGRGPDAAVSALLLACEGFLREWVGGLKTNPRLVRDLAPLEAALARLDASAIAPTPARQHTPRRAPAGSTLAAAAAAGPGDETLRIPAASLDHLIQLVGELSLHQSILDRAAKESQLDSPSARGVIDVQSKLLQDLHAAAITLRMIPVEGVFQKIERVVRETAQQLGKKVRVERHGDEVSLDKLVIEGMFEPLIHIARNAVDHGIETPETRQAIGKDPEGWIHISAENTASGVTITFADDGKGIDHETVFRKAVEKGLVGADESLSPEARLQLIFLPGLSTAEKVTEISGRGVGMDVVADSVKRMGGRVDLESRKGTGTRLAVTLPTNLSILAALVVRVGGCQYAIPNQDLAEVIDLREHNLTRVNGGESQVIELRGEVVPVEEMSAFLNATSSVPTDGPRPGVIVQYHDSRLALAVDSVVGQQQVFVRPVIGHLAPIGYYGGSTILSDGEPSIILNVSEMARVYFTSH